MWMGQGKKKIKLLSMKILSHFKIVFRSRVIQLNATSKRVTALKSKNKNFDK